MVDRAVEKILYNDLNESTKKENTLYECSPSFKIGDPYGN